MQLYLWRGIQKGDPTRCAWRGMDTNLVRQQRICAFLGKADACKSICDPAGNETEAPQAVQEGLLLRCHTHTHTHN